MAKKELLQYDPRVDAYIEASAEFAHPLMLKLRQLVHALCPDVYEDIKWGFPQFIYRDAMLCSMAAFKAHCAFGFWKAAMMEDPEGRLSVAANAAMGHFGRISTDKDLPTKKLLAFYMAQAMKLNENEKDIKPAKKAVAKKRVAMPLHVPDDLVKALQNNPLAEQTFEGFSPSHRKEYVEWICSAKREETRLRRIEQALRQMEEGKSQHWKYQKS